MEIKSGLRFEMIDYKQGYEKKFYSLSGKLWYVFDIKQSDTSKDYIVVVIESDW